VKLPPTPLGRDRHGGASIRLARDLSTPRPKAQGLPATRDFGELSRAAQAEELEVHLHFDKLSVLSPSINSGP